MVFKVQIFHGNKADAVFKSLFDDCINISVDNAMPVSGSRGHVINDSIYFLQCSLAADAIVSHPFFHLS